jgi:hypothetical protein
MKHAGSWLEAHMTGYWGPRQRRRRWPLLGLLLVALMLGHDALMASEALEAPHEAGAVAAHAPVSSGREDVLPAHHEEPPLPRHPEQCSVGFVALSRGVDDAAGMAHPRLPVALTMVAVRPAPVWVRGAAWEEPHWPPGTLRALTQVFRI